MPPDAFPADGIYWGNIVPDVASDALGVELSRVFMGDACWDRAAELGLSDGEACLDDYRVEDDTTILISVPDATRASAARADGPGVSHRVDAGLLEAMSEGENVGDVPIDSSYSPFPVVVAVRNGVVVAVDQYWVP